MKAIIFNRYGGPEVLEYTDVVTPRPGNQDLLVKVGAASVNPVDWKVGTEAEVHHRTEISQVPRW